MIQIRVSRMETLILNDIIWYALGKILKNKLNIRFYNDDF